MPDPTLYYQLLPVHHVKIHGRRGVKILGLWYDGPGLDPYRATLSSRGGRHRGTWAIHRDPRDRRHVYFADPGDGGWHVLRWTGLPPAGDVPAFSDARVQDVLREASSCGLKPRDDTELLPTLLQLLAARTPVHAWPTQLPKQQSTDRAREAARDVRRDRPAASPPPARRVDQPRPLTAEPAVGQLASTPPDVAAPSRLGDGYRRRSLFLITGAADDNSSADGQAIL